MQRALHLFGMPICLYDVMQVFLNVWRKQLIGKIWPLGCVDLGAGTIAMSHSDNACAAGFGFTPTGSSAPSLAPFSGSFGSTTAQSAPQSTPALFGIIPQSAPAFGVASSSGQSTPAVPAFGLSAPAASQAAPAFGLLAASSATPAASQGQSTAASGQSGPSFGSFGFGASSAATSGPAAGEHQFPSLLA